MSPLRWLSVCCFVVCGWCAGDSFHQQAQAHLEALHKTLDLLETLHQEISFRRSDLNLLCRKLIQDGQLPPETVSLQTLEPFPSLTLEERTRFSECFSGLGRLEAEQECRRLELYQAQFQAALQEGEAAAVLITNTSLPDMKWVEVESKLEQARSMERISRKNLEDRNLYAPFGGVIGKRMVEAGENVQPGQPVFSLLRIEAVNVKIAVPENEVATLGDQAAMIKVAALGGQCFEGKVTEKGIVANPISHTYEAKIRLENPSGALLPGMVCDVRLSGEESVPAIALPNNAVLIANDGGRFVWKIVDGEAKATPVRTGDLTEQGLFILEGLNEGVLLSQLNAQCTGFDDLFSLE
mgnify:CR=1 FL=1